MTTHSTTVHRTGEYLGMDYDFEIEVEYEVTPGCPETGPSFASGGEPAEGPEIEIISATCDGKDVELTDAEIEKILEGHDWDDVEDFDEDRARDRDRYDDDI